mgnify:FL=1
MKKVFILFALLFIAASGVAQKDKPLAQKLGFDSDAKLLIIHADDIGVAHSVNSASFDGFSTKSITSGSVMVPCPWFLEAAEYAKSNPNHDLGLHLTLTSEWKNYKWSGIASKDEIESLINKQGHFYASNKGIKRNATYQDVKKELKSQIKYAVDNGLDPTHLDTHMGAVTVRPDIVQAYFEVGHEHNLPILLSKEFESIIEVIDASKFDTSKLVWAEKIYQKSDDSPIDYPSWKKFYSEVIEDIEPGLNVLLVHLGYDNDELKAVTIDHPAYGAAWRGLDAKVLQDQAFLNLMIEKNIKLIRWRQIKDILY